MSPLSTSMGSGAGRPTGRLLATLSLLALLMALVVPAALADKPGTVKVSGVQTQNDPDNQPHVPCQFSLEFFQFEAQTVHVDFAAQQPSGDVHLLTDTVTLDPSGDEEPTFNGTEGYDFTGMLDDLERHEEQGYHIKVTVQEEASTQPAKHKVFWLDCPAPQPAEAKVTVSKAVTGDDAPAAGTQFAFTLVCDGTTVSFTLADGESTTWADQSDVTLAEGAPCTLEETDEQDATTVSLAFNGTEVDEGETVTLAADANGFSVTNDFPAEGGDEVAADLLVDKVVTGDDAPGADTVFTIEVSCDGTDVTAMLADGDEPWSWNDDSGEAALTDASVCWVDETDDQGADTVTVTFNGAASDEQTDQDLGEGDNTFVVTNDFPGEGDVGGVDVEAPIQQPGPDVSPDDVDAAPSDEQPAAAQDVSDEDTQPAAAQDVADAEVTEGELPATGASNTALLLVALGLIGGGALVLRRADARVRAN